MAPSKQEVKGQIKALEFLHRTVKDAVGPELKNQNGPLGKVPAMQAGIHVKSQGDGAPL